MSATRIIFPKVLSASILIAMTGCATSPGINQPDSAAAVMSTRAVSSNLDYARREFGRGNYGSAIEYLEKELASRPASVAALNGLGACYDQLGRYDVAQRYYFRALDLAPDSSQTLSNIGYSYLQQGRHREAVTILEHALQKDGADQVAANNLELARDGLVQGDQPVQVVRSTNNGSQADEIDFLSLLALLQRSNDRTVPALADAPVSSPGSSPARTVPVVIAAGEPTAITRSSQIDAPPPVIADQQGSARIDSNPGDAGALNERAGDPVPRGDAQSVIDTSTVQEQATTARDEPVPGRSLTPVSPGDTASLALVTGSTAVVTPVLEPVPENDGGFSDETPAQEAPALTLTIVDSPQLDPARISDVAPSLANLSEPLNLVVENGNGVPGIARATSNWLQGEKLDIKRVGDAQSFDFAQTVIYYRPELAPYAREIAASLNLSCELQPSTELAEGADVRVVLGHDFASQVSVGGGGLAFEETPSTDYLRGIIRLEVANGNGVNGMAARVREFLNSNGSNVVRISDADSWNYEKTVLYYRSGTRIAAEALARSLPLSSVELIETPRLRAETDARLVIGSDFVPFDNLVLN